VSYGSMMNQLHRTAQFRYSLDSRMKLIKKAMKKKDEDDKKDED